MEADKASVDQLEENLEQSLAKTSEEDYLVTNFEDDFSSDEGFSDYASDSDLAD